MGILGYGEIGKAVGEFYEKFYIKDLKEDNFPDKIDILHVCFGMSDSFVMDVVNVAKKHNVGLVIIHSTVPVGTTRAICGFHKFTVHSPCSGVHPHLHEGLRTFTKFIGANDAVSGSTTAKHFKKLGMNTKVFYKSETTELMKLLDTTYYGLIIAYHAYANEFCQDLELNFDNVMTEWNKSYNKGYKKLKKSNVIRPILYPLDGKIGGHCVINNAKLLKQQFGEDPILTSILRHA